MGGSPVPTSHTRTICSCWSTRTRLLQLEASSTLSYYTRYFTIYSTFHYRQVLQLVGKKALWLPGSLPDHSHLQCVPHTLPPLPSAYPPLPPLLHFPLPTPIWAPVDGLEVSLQKDGLEAQKPFKNNNIDNIDDTDSRIFWQHHHHLPPVPRQCV